MSVLSFKFVLIFLVTKQHLRLDIEFEFKFATKLLILRAFPQHTLQSSREKCHKTRFLSTLLRSYFKV